MKILAKIICWLGIAFSMLVAILVSIIGKKEAILSIFILIVGPLFSWTSSFVMYGFGELIDKSTEIAKNTRKY